MNSPLKVSGEEVDGNLTIKSVSPLLYFANTTSSTTASLNFNGTNLISSYGIEIDGNLTIKSATSVLTFTNTTSNTSATFTWNGTKFVMSNYLNVPGITST